MANIKFTNFARSTLAVGAAPGATSLSLAAGTGLKFPSLGAGEYFYLTIEDAALNREIVKVTARSTDTVTVVRAQDNTTAQTWSAGAVAALRFNALAISEAVTGTLLAANNLSDVANAATARANLGAQAAGSYAASGANSDITSLTGLTSPVSEVRQLQPITAAIASNAITITPSALSLEFRNTTLTNGAVSFVEGTPTALVIAATDSFGLVTAAGNQRIAILAINNAGTIELAAAAMAGGASLDETGVITTATAATLGTHIKAANVRTGVAYRVIGFVDATFTTATGWGSLALVQGTGGQAMAAMSSLGYGQTWQNVTGSRTLSTTYYNTTGRPTTVVVYGAPTGGSTGSGYAMTATVNGVALPVGGAVQGYSYWNATFVVPPGASYSVSIAVASTLSGWSELR